jgi:hypothetical protein
MPISDKEIEEILSKYRKNLNKRISLEEVEEYKPNPEFSKEYLKFRKEALSRGMSAYEKWCKFASSIIKVRPPKKGLTKLEADIERAHLDISASDARAFAMLVSGLIMLLFLFIGVAGYLSTKNMNLALISAFVILVAYLMIDPLTRIPSSMATRIRLRAGNQMVLCILYMVIYMRHTSNLENAIKFAADYVGNPLALDLRKVFWDVEVGKYTTIKESLDRYLMTWRDTHLEFVNAFHLIESSLYEPSEDRRLELLDKALDVILNGIHDKMMRYAQELKSPITMVHMLGVILPMLSLVIFPLMGVFLGGAVKWWYLAVFYNLLLPFLVYSLGNNILIKRPSSAGEFEIKPSGPKIVGVFCVFLFVLFVLIGISPFIIHVLNPKFEVVFLGDERLLDFECVGNKCYGPYGFGALILSLFIPLGLALSIGIYNISRTNRFMKLREGVKKLETEFSGALFQLGNRIGDGVPAENAFQEVAEVMEGTPTGGFLKRVHYNLSRLGMGLKEAIFDRERGAIVGSPSSLVRSSMQVLIESAKKGPKVVAQSLISISNYVSNVHRVNERLRDLLADIISSIKSQIKFMAPVIAAIVVGLASMIVSVISRLGAMLEAIETGTLSADRIPFDINAFANLFQKVEAIPGYFFQVIIGIYVIEVVYILSVLGNGIEYGVDELNEKNSVGKNVLRSGILYVILALIFIVIFNRLVYLALTFSTAVTP